MDSGAYRHVLSFPNFYRAGFAAARHVPKSWLYRLADLLGTASHATYRTAVRNVRANLARALPDAPPQRIRLLSRKVFRNFARYLVDFGTFRDIDGDLLQTVFPVTEGIENLDRALSTGRGIVLVTGHVGNWELGGLYFGHLLPKVHVVTLPDGVEKIDEIRRGYRGKHNIRTIVLDGSPYPALEMMAALRRQEMLAMLVDRWDGRDGFEGEFFGIRRPFPRGPIALSRATGAPILPAYVVKEGNHYRGIFQEPFTAGGEDDAACARRILAGLEKVIRRYPDQWYNFWPLGTTDPNRGEP